MDSNAAGTSANSRRGEARRPPTFEQAYARLEQILERISGEQVTLEESVTLCEEAEALIRACNDRLSDAERRVEVLFKDKEGQLITSDNGEAQKEPFNRKEGAVFAASESV